MEDLITLGGNVIPTQDLKDSRAAAFAYYAGNPENPAFELVECRHSPGVECVVVRAFAEVPQRPRHDIRSEEPLLVMFLQDERSLPDVLTLRRDFPSVPHLNLRHTPVPKSLCLFAERPEDVFLRWTPALLGQRILWWLSETARGNLHQQDQALEPFISGELRPLVIPATLFAQGREEVLVVSETDAGLGRSVLIAERPDHHSGTSPNAGVTLLAFMLPVQEHGVINLEPQTMRQLQELCLSGGFDLLHALKEILSSKIGQLSPDSVGTILLLAIPKSRGSDTEVEAFDYYGFRCAVPVGIAPNSPLNEVGPRRLGEALGVLARQGSWQVPVIGGGQDVDAGLAEGVYLQMLIPRAALIPELAAAFSGHSERGTTRFLAIGQGALGSQIFANLAKQGYGQWTLLDEDYLLPHNLVRHAVMGRSIGRAKATEMARQINAMYPSAPLARGIVVNLLFPGPQAEAVSQSLDDAEIILDMSASVAVSRYLALDAYSSAMRVAAFLSPSGNDLVFMSEGKGRAITIDAIETQYLRTVLDEESLVGHLDGGDEQVRYGGSCRDVSARISPESVALHAAFGAAAVRRTASTGKSMLVVWRYSPEQIAVERLELPLRATITLNAGEWTIVTDEGLRDKLMALRQAKLPRETCGVIIGYFDMVHKRIYVVDVLPAPPDSQEEPDGCLRGVQGLQDAVASASKKTLGQVEYIGEWHSHPDAISCTPSLSDRTQMEWLKMRMHPEVKPALILIACENHVLTAFLHKP